MANPTPTPYQTSDPRFNKLKDRPWQSDYFNPETWDKMPEERRAAMLLILAEILGNEGRGNPTTPGTPFWKAPQIASKEAAKQAAAPGAGVAVRRGKWVMDPESGQKIYQGDPRYNEIIKSAGGGAEAITGED